MLDGTGHADPDADEPGVGVAAGGEQPAALGDHVVEHRLGPVGDGDLVGVRGEDVAGEIGEGDGGVRGAEIDGQHDARQRVEGDARGRPSARRDRLSGGAHEAGCEEHVDAARHGGAGEPGEGGELRFGAPPAVAEDLEDLPGAGIGGRDAAHEFDHGDSKAQRLPSAGARLSVTNASLLTSD